MKAARIEAELSAKAKSSFLGTMSHELRTPLNAIIGFSEIIEAAAGKSADETLAGNANEIRKAGRHMLGVINDILEMSKIESGALQLNLLNYSLAEIVEDCVPLIRERIDVSGARLRDGRGDRSLKMRRRVQRRASGGDGITKDPSGEGSHALC